MYVNITLILSTVIAPGAVNSTEPVSKETCRDAEHNDDNGSDLISEADKLFKAHFCLLIIAEWQEVRDLLIFITTIQLFYSFFTISCICAFDCPGAFSILVK